MKVYRVVGKFSLLLIMVSVLAGCGKKWKKPTTVSIAFEAPAISDDGGNSAGELALNGGEISFLDLQILGNRKQGDDINFENGDDKTFFLDEEVNQDVYQIDIPQGTYTDLNFILSVGENDEEHAVKVVGKYTSDAGIQANVVFKTKVSQVIRMQVLDSDGSEEIVLIADQARSLKVEIDIDDWFSAVTHNMWESADHQGANSHSAILIDEDHNPTIYNILYSRLHQGFSATFE